MRAVLTLDQRYWSTPGGEVWTRMPPGYAFLAEPLTVFDRVRVIARVAPIAEPPPGAIRADGPGVEFWPVPCYAGPAAFMTAVPRLFHALRGAVASDDALILRIPSQLANCVWLTHRGASAVEILADPWDLYAPGAMRGLLRPLYRQWFSSMVRRQAASAVALASVSRAIEERYPSRRSVRYVDVELAPAGAPRRLRNPPWHVVTVGGFDHPVKGHDVLIRALQGLPVRLTIVGGGRLRGELEQLASRHGVALTFAGELGGAARVRDVLDTADLFVLASRSEGMPRALIEAMNAGVPAVGTAIGGMPELLPASQLARPNDVQSLKTAVIESLCSADDYYERSVRGLRTAARFGSEGDTRRRFLELVRETVLTTRRRGGEWNSTTNRQADITPRS